MKRALLILLMMSVILGTSGDEPQADQRAHNRKNLIFSRIERATSRVRTISSDFLEEKHLAMLQEPVFSRGRFYFEKPDGLRWELIEPGPSGFAVKGNRAIRWRGQNDESKFFEIHEAPGIKAFVDQVFAWVRADFEWLEKAYNIEVVHENPAALKLLPLSISEKDYIDHLRIVFANDLSHVSTIEIHEANGDLTRIRFMNIVLNGPRRKDLF